MLPIGTPQEKSASAMARLSAKKEREISAWPVGVLPASAAATVTRDSTMWRKFWAKPVTAVATLQTPSASASTLRGLPRSASRANGRPATL